MIRRFSLLLPLFLCGAVGTSLVTSSADEPAQGASGATIAADSQDSEEEGEQKADDEEWAKEDEEKAEADEPKKEKEEKDAEPVKKRETHKVEAKKFQTEVEVDGTFVARQMTEVELRPEEWSSFEITEIVPHGATVREGEQLVKFDDEDLNEAIADLEHEQRISELALRKSEEELPRVEKILSMTLEEAEKAYARVQEDQKHYEEVERELMVKSAKQQLKNAHQYLDYEREELDQLEKMYAADDLTEETEEIILKRQKAAVESAEFYVEQATVYHDRTMNVYLPRQDVDRKERLEQARIALERAKLAHQVDIPKSRYDLEKLKQDRVKSLERHAKLTKDKLLMTLKAPAEGLVYYGSCVDGQWSEMASMIGKLQPKNNAPTGTVLFTIVAPRPMYVLATIDEKNRPEINSDQPVEVKPVAEGDQKLSGKVAKVSPVPVASGKFSLQVDLEDGKLPEWLVPGMSSKAKITTYTAKEAIVVPKKAVHDEEEDDSKKFVWIVDENDAEKPAEKRSVKLGKSKGDDVEVVEGLKAGEVISLEDETKKSEEEEKTAD